MRRISRIDSMEGESAYRNCHPDRQRGIFCLGIVASLATITVEKIPRGCSG